ncbi:MAG: hypothetical protein Q7U98_16965 [Methylicorpusculum sp.]|uniref:hypothetical protein n=1 Tax=Methylicorpusculum sp. TaxID=2713644 RepID=UPI00272840D4|nr:hypothetical protein [Methylicorpusculum sp.]MDO8842898.1 hypothetical protein [Methylicorpusculum sp.]MDO8940848.1 hypothetical protein [Methylicorpusculum sp.]MDP2204388.1 hypothetical protein [Methylicorpusculum sp.]
MKRNISLISLCLILSSLNSYADYYDVPMLEASWVLSKTKSACLLTQEIPRYGKAEFVHQSGSSLRFSIQEYRVRPTIIKANLAIAPAQWMHHEASFDQHLVYLDPPEKIKDFSRLSAYGDAAELMMDALLQGHSPTFIYLSAISDLDMREIRVAVSPIKFGIAYDEFLNCRKNMVHSRSTPENF